MLWRVGECGREEELLQGKGQARHLTYVGGDCRSPREKNPGTVEGIEGCTNWDRDPAALSGVVGRSSKTSPIFSVDGLQEGAQPALVGTVQETVRLVDDQEPQVGE